MADFNHSKYSGKINKIAFWSQTSVLAVLVLLATPDLFWIYSIHCAYRNLSELKLEGASDHLERALSISGLCRHSKEKTATGMKLLCDILLTRGNLTKAEAIIQEALLFEKQHFRTESRLIPLMMAKAELSRRRGDYSEALLIYKDIEKIIDHSQGKDSVLARVRRQTGILRLLEGNYSQAGNVFRDLSSLYTNLSLNTVPNIIDLNLQLSLVEEGRGDYQAALNYLDQAEKVYIENSWQETSFLVSICNLKAELYLNQGDLDKAEPLVTRAYLLSQDKSPVNILQAGNLQPLLNLSSIYLERRRFDRARILNREAVMISEQRLGPNQPAYASAFAHKGILLFHEGKADEAFEILEKAQNETVNQRTRARIDRYMARLFMEAGQSEEAACHYKEALAKLESCLNRKHPEYVQVEAEFSNLSMLKEKNKRNDVNKIAYLEN